MNHDAFPVEKTLESVYGTVKPSLGVLQEWKRVQERSATGRTGLLDAEVTGRGKVRKGWRRGWVGWKETKCSHVTFHVGWRNVSFVENGGRGSREPTYPFHTHTCRVPQLLCPNPSFVVVSSRRHVLATRMPQRACGRRHDASDTPEKGTRSCRGREGGQGG